MPVIRAGNRQEGHGCQARCSIGGYFASLSGRWGLPQPYVAISARVTHFATGSYGQAPSVGTGLSLGRCKGRVLSRLRTGLLKCDIHHAKQAVRNAIKERVNDSPR